MHTPSSVRSEHLDYLPHVDGLRALAVALVVVFHAWPNALPGGFIGVDVFFVISGFIITRQIAHDMERGAFSYTAFLGRRARRLIPAAFVCSVLVSLAAIVWLMPEALTTFGESLASVWTMTANFFFYAHSDYFDAPSAEAPMLHMWSLAVEDQFYLTWPLVLLLLFRGLHSRGRIAAAALALAAVSLVHSDLATRSDPSFAFFMLPSRAFELLAGCVLALTVHRLGSLPTAVRGIADGIGLALVAGSALVLHAGVPFPGLAVVPAIVGCVLLIAAGLSGPTLVSRHFSRAPVVLVGRMSYSIYLYHWPLLAIATYHLGRAPDASEAGLLVLASLVLGALSWLLVEQMLTRRLGLHDMAPSGLLVLTVAISTAFCLLAVATVAGHGWPQRLDEVAQKVYRAASTGNPLRTSCDGYDHAFRNDARCTFGRPLGDKRSYDIAIFGDSNADQFVPLVAELAERAGLSGRQVTQTSCGPLIGVSAGRSPYLEEQCARYQETIIAFLDRNPDLKIAVLSSVWSTYWNPHNNRVSNDAGRVSFAHVAEETIQLFRSRGLKVLVIGQIPHFQSFSLRCLAEAHRKDSEERDCVIPRDNLSQAVFSAQEVLETIDHADDGVSFVNMLDLLCTPSSCSAFKDDVLLYRDRAHLNAKGAEYLARYASLPSLNR